MARHSSASRRDRRDAGFALIEYVITVSIMGVIVGILCAAVVVVIRNQENSERRNDASNGALGLTNYFPADIASTPPGGRETSATLESGCSGYDDKGHNIIRLTWSETLFGATTDYRVAYRLVQSGDGGEILRVACSSNSGSYGSADVRRVAFSLAPVPDDWMAGDAPAALTPLSGDGPVTLTLTAANGDLVNVQGTGHNPDDALAPYVPPSPNAAIETTFTLAVPNYSTVGEVLTYSITVANSGSVPLTGVGVTLSNASLASPCAPTLASGVNSTCTATHTVTQDDLDSGTITAEILAYGYYGSVAVSADAINTVSAAAAPSVAPLMTSSSTGYSATDEVIPYNVTVTNNGNITLTSLAVAHSNATETAACAPLPLAPGATATCSASHTVTGGEFGTTVSNVVTVTGSTANHGDTAAISTASVDIPFLATPEVSIRVFEADPSPITTLGETVTYTVRLRNIGNVALTNVAATYSLSTPLVACATTLAVGAQTDCTSTYVVTQADLDAGGITNTATVSAAYDGETVGATATLDTPASDLRGISALLRTSESSFSEVGETLNLSLRITNTGSISMWSLDVWFINATLGTCTDYDLSPGEVAICSATHIVTATELGADLNVTGYARGWNGFWGWTTTESSMLTVPFLAQPELTITEFSATPSPFVGSGVTVTFSVTVQNTGNVALSGVALTHTNANTLTSCATSLAIGATTTCTATHVTTASEANDGVIDIASVSGTWSTSTAIAVSSLTVPAAQPCTVTSATSGGIATPTTVDRVTNNSDGKKDMLLSDVQITITTSGACTGLRVKYFPKTPSSVVADMTESSPGVWLAVIPGENSDGAAKWSAGTKQVQVLPASTVGNTAIYTNTAAFTVT